MVDRSSNVTSPKHRQCGFAGASRFEWFVTLYLKIRFLYSNQFTFNGVLSPIQQATKTAFNFNQYTPQDSIFKDTTYQTTEGSNLTINLGIDDTVTTNVY